MGNRWQLGEEGCGMFNGILGSGGSVRTSVLTGPTRQIPSRNVDHADDNTIPQKKELAA